MPAIKTKAIRLYEEAYEEFCSYQKSYAEKYAHFDKKRSEQQTRLAILIKKYNISPEELKKDEYLFHLEVRFEDALYHAAYMTDITHLEYLESDCYETEAFVEGQRTKLQALFRKTPYEYQQARANDLVKANDLSVTIRHVFRRRNTTQRLQDAEKEGEPAQLIGSLLHQNDLCIVNARTGFGKSTLVTQWADVIAKGISFCDAMPNTHQQPLRVTIFDLENQDSHFLQRYKNADLSPRLNFIDLNLKNDAIETVFENKDLIIKAIDTEVKENKSEVIILDNVAFWGVDMQKTILATQLMRELSLLKNQLRITLIIVTHTPKLDMTQPRSINDISGAMSVTNFVESVVSLSVSSLDANLRYIKQLKIRGGAEEFGEDNVAVFAFAEDVANGEPFYRFIETDWEEKHLKKTNYEQKANKKEAVLALLQQGKTYREIAIIENISIATVSRWGKHQPPPTAPPIADTLLPF